MDSVIMYYFCQSFDVNPAFPFLLVFYKYLNKENEKPELELVENGNSTVFTSSFLGISSSSLPGPSQSQRPAL